jgi:hypothetical protein
LDRTPTRYQSCGPRKIFNSIGIRGFWEGSASSGRGVYAEVLFRRTQGPDRTGVIIPQQDGTRSDMRDFVIALLFVAMVLTPAIVAARSGKDLGAGK